MARPWVAECWAEVISLIYEPNHRDKPQSAFYCFDCCFEYQHVSETRWRGRGEIGEQMERCAPKENAWSQRNSLIRSTISRGLSPNRGVCDDAPGDVRRMLVRVTLIRLNTRSRRKTTLEFHFLCGPGHPSTHSLPDDGGWGVHTVSGRLPGSPFFPLSRLLKWHGQQIIFSFNPVQARRAELQPESRHCYRLQASGSKTGTGSCRADTKSQLMATLSHALLLMFSFS